ncbi:MAG TPA: 16S rRNA (cytosine(967)-C(5))-methyltransferase RsmB, partial [Armatimonadetes bacterium]|nr:16S rRNA (cytosine(967)-C(5))-methyltransferase RsmB [Armatimonadota bacterium]
TTSHPHWMVKRWIKQWGVDETLKLCDANNQPPPVCIRVNLRWTECELVQRMLEMRCRKVEASPYVPCGLRIETTRDVSLLPGFQEGLFSVQDEAAMLVGYVVDPQPGELIIDACAAPGGKATHMAELTGDQAHIIAIDVNPNRMELVKEMVTRLKLQGVEMVIGDFTELAHQYRRSADRCLLDVPCSGTGTLRRKPDVRWKKSIERIRELSELQAQLLEAAAGVVKRNGIIVYSTCSLEKEENEIIVREFLARHPEFELEDATAYLPSSIPNCCTDDGFIRLFPHRHDTDGAFIARLRRKCA